MNNKKFLDNLDGGWNDVISDTYKDANKGFIPETVLNNKGHKVIDAEAYFYHEGNVSEIGLSMPEGLYGINYNAFGDSNFNGNLHLPDGLNYIGTEAFKYCTGLSGDLIIPDSVKFIGDLAFICCTGFTSLKLSNNLDKIAAQSFYKCTGLSGTLEIPSSVQYTDEQCFTGCENLETLILNDGLQIIGIESFANCKKLTGDLIIPDTVTSINYRAFANCPNLNGTLYIPKSVEEIYSRAFEGTNFSKILVQSDRFYEYNPNWLKGTNVDIDLYR